MNKLSKHLLVSVFSLMMFSNKLLAKENPSFDCTKATTEVEKLICSDDELAKLDVEMNKSYHAFMKTLDEEYYRNKLKKKQLDWLSYREKLSCFNTDDTKKTNCLKNAYQRRIENLNAWTARQNYNFFIDYPDYYEQSKRVGYRKRMGKFISKLGEEYYIECKKNIIIPKFPEEKVYFDNYPGPLPYMNSYVEINHTEEDFVYFRCEEIGESRGDQSLTKFSKDMIKPDYKYDKLKAYPENEDNKDNIIQFIKKEATQNNNIDLIKHTENEKALSPKKCMELWEKLKNNNFEVVSFIRANSPFELKEKANINCTHEQFYKMAKNKYGGYLHFTPPFRVYSINKKTYLIGQEYTTSRNICQVEEHKCHCIDIVSTVWSEAKTLLKIQNQFYFIEYDNFKSKVLSLTQLSDETMKEKYLQKSCMFKFTGSKGE